MDGPLLDEDRVLQICFVTESLDRSIGWFGELTGKTPVHVGDIANAPQARATYKGHPAGLSCRQAIFRLGNIDVEFIEPGPEPSVWRDVLEQKGPGCHHLAFRTADMAHGSARLEAAGLSLLQTGEFGTGRYAYFDAEAALGTQLELLEFDNDGKSGA